MRKFLRISLFIGAVFYCFAAPSGGAETASPPDLVVTLPDQEQFRQIVEMGLSARHDEALKLAAEYTAKYKDHPCGYFVQGLVHEWRIEPQIPEPFLGPAIDGFEEAGRRKPETAVEKRDIPAGICSGAALVRLSRIYYKYGEYFKSVKRAVTGGRELERIAALAPEAYDIYTFLGPYHYFAEKAPTSARFFLRLFGLKGNKVQGLQELELAWHKAPLFHDEAGQVLYVIQTKWEGQHEKYDPIVDELIERYPQNVIFRRLKSATQAQIAATMPP